MYTTPEGSNPEAAIRRISPSLEVQLIPDCRSDPVPYPSLLAAKRLPSVAPRFGAGYAATHERGALKGRAWYSSKSPVDSWTPGGRASIMVE